MKELLPTNTADSNNATDRLHQNEEKNGEKELRCERKKNNFLQKIRRHKKKTHMKTQYTVLTIS